MDGLLHIILYIILLLLVLQGVLSLAEGVQFLLWVRRNLLDRPSPDLPAATVIVPCKGEDKGLEQNLDALLKQEYPAYTVIFAVASVSDPSVSAIEHAIKQNPSCPSQLVVASKSDTCSEKISNLLSAIAEAPAQTEVFAFADSDARVRPDWLASLIGPLSERNVGAVTGYRWYVPEKLGLWPALLAAWNGAIATTLGDHRRNFAWGGSTAITKATFDRIGVAGRWTRAASDDYALTKAVQDAGLYVRFQPRCLVPSFEDASLADLLEFTTRQVIITRVYRPKVWWVGLIMHSLFVFGFFGGIAMTLAERNLRTSIAAGVIYVLGSLKGVLRMLAVSEALPDLKGRIIRFWWMFCLLWPLVSLVFLYNFALSTMTRRITWRGVRYELRSPAETIILGEPQTEELGPAGGRV